MRKNIFTVVTAGLLIAMTLSSCSVKFTGSGSNKTENSGSPVKVTKHYDFSLSGPSGKSKITMSFLD